MKSTDAPVKHPVPFGANGSREAITATTPSGTNQASYDVGFPPITMTLKSAGGLPPKGQDMNQILFEHDSFNRYFSAGGGYVYDSTFSTSIGGYPLGARVPNSTGNGYWLNTVQDNTVNPENTTSALTGWVPDRSYGITAISGLVATSQVMTTLAASKDRITLAGSLTANINIVVPAWVKKWDVVNNCTGAFTVTIKTASGTGVAIPSGLTATVFGDGTNVIMDAPVFGVPGRLINTQIFTTNGTYTPTAGTTSIVVEVQGGGAGGGGIGAAGTSTVAVGNGGSGGGYLKSRFTSGFSGGIAITVGIGGAGGNLAPTNGTNGGVSMFGSLMTAGGGQGGIAQPQTTPPFSVTGSAGGSGGSVGNILAINGMSSAHGFALNTTSVSSGQGGGSQLGAGGFSPANNGGSPNNASGYGGGGGGSYAFNRSGFSGGSGSSGVVIIWEYS